MHRRAGSPNQGVERVDPEANAGQDMTDETPLPKPASSNSGSAMSVTGSTSVIRTGCGSQPREEVAGGRAAKARPRALQPKGPSDSLEWYALAGGQLTCGGDHVTQRGRRGEDEGSADHRGRFGERACCQRARPGDVHPRTAAPMPKAGPYSANGANAATSRSSG